MSGIVMVLGALLTNNNGTVYIGNAYVFDQSAGNSVAVSTRPPAKKMETGRKRPSSPLVMEILETTLISVAIVRDTASIITTKDDS